MVIPDDLVNKVDAADQIRETGSLEQYRPVGYRSLFLLHTNLLVEQLCLLLFQRLVGGDTAGVKFNLGLQQIDLLRQSRIALIQQILLLLGVGFVIFDLVQLVFQVIHFLPLIIDLLLELFILLADSVGVGRRISGRAVHCGRRQQCRRHQQRA